MLEKTKETAKFLFDILSNEKANEIIGNKYIELKEEELQLKKQKQELELEITEKDFAITKMIAEAVDDKGKKLYKNDTERKAKKIQLLKEDKNYQDNLLKLKEINDHLEDVQFAIHFLDKFYK